VILDNYDNQSEDPADEEALERVMEWEVALMEFIDEWMADEEKYKNFDIAYYTERSVTDEVARGSEGDIVTIFVSYLIMLVYVAVALGRITKFSSFLVRMPFDKLFLSS
jgi:Niemann-Pick C1 protein